tara:strand:+ start:1194 stop:1604 length:411 start_codon:yes stop_codon:yes gene_type:complete
MITVFPGVSKHGIGLFTVRQMKKGDIVCNCNPSSNLSEERSSLYEEPEGVRDIVHSVFDGYTPLSPIDSIPIVCFLNHSTKPNCMYDENSNTIKTLNRIEGNVELTIDYTDYLDADSPNFKFANLGFKSKPWATTT